jgi:probable rRNA maturation factor
LTQITFSDRQRSVKLDAAWFEGFSKTALAECLKHPFGNETVLAGLENVDVIIVSNRVIADIHRRFMNVKGSTDVITVDHGEIIISAPMAQTNAKRFGNALDHEVGLCIIHGLLHLNGYSDKGAEETRIMHKLQNRILARCMASYGRRS